MIEDPDTLRRLRRQPLILIALFDVLVLAVGSTAAIDLRRLQTPTGTALAWTQAALFGDCADYRRYSVPDVTDRRGPDQRCQDLRTRTQDNRAASASIALRRRDSRTTGSTATVHLQVIRKGAPNTAELHLRWVGGQWLVLLDATTCSNVGCA